MHHFGAIGQTEMEKTVKRIRKNAELAALRCNLLFGGVIWIGLFVVLAGVDEEIGQIHVKDAVSVFGKADGACQ